MISSIITLIGIAGSITTSTSIVAKLVQKNDIDSQFFIMLGVFGTAALHQLIV